jgi:PAT family beta-lactamase induction signal transducer AmpG
VFGTLSFWLREAGIDRTTIGFMSWIGLAYAFKWAWSPMVDRLPIPVLTRCLGRRRSWLLLAQAMIMAALVGMALTRSPAIADAGGVVRHRRGGGFCHPDMSPSTPPYRVRRRDHQAALAATYQTGYRIAMILARDAGAICRMCRPHRVRGAWIVAPACPARALANRLFDDGAEHVARGCHGVASKEPHAGPLAPEQKPTGVAASARWLDPFADFLRRYRVQAVVILALIATYRISDVVMGIMAILFMWTWVTPKTRWPQSPKFTAC